MRWKLFLALLSVLLVRDALATIPLYINNDPEFYQVYYYTVSPNPPPTIDATAFFNNNTFSVSYANYSPTPVLFQTLNTLNYTNLSTFIANSPATTNGAILEFGLGSFGVGYDFDLHTTNQIPDAMAGSFYNPGKIRCDSVQDGNNLFGIGDGLFFYEVTSIGQFKAWATNITSQGSIDVGTAGLIQLAGRNVDLTGGSLSVEGPLNTTGNENIIGEIIDRYFGCRYHNNDRLFDL